MSSGDERPRTPTAALPNDQDIDTMTGAAVIDAADVSSTSQPQTSTADGEQAASRSPDDEEDGDNDDEDDDDGEGFRLRGPFSSSIGRGTNPNLLRGRGGRPASTTTSHHVTSGTDPKKVPINNVKSDDKSKK